MPFRSQSLMPVQSLRKPVHQPAQYVELVQRRPAAAVSHPGRQENPAPLGCFLGAAIELRYIGWIINLSSCMFL
jgi:hypothetical protein